MNYEQIKSICEPSHQPLAMCPINNFKRCSRENCPLTNIEEKNLIKTIKLRKEIRSLQNIIDNFYAKAAVDESVIDRFLDEIQDRIDNITEIVQ